MLPATCNGRLQRRPKPKTRSNNQPVAPIIDGGYNLGTPSVRLTIIVRLDQAASLDRLDEFVEVRQTPIGTDVSLLLSAADGPSAARCCGMTLMTEIGTAPSRGWKTWARTQRTTISLFSGR